jgi:hypothetical protein
VPAPRRSQQPLLDVNGRTVFITGAARGIGAAMLILRGLIQPITERIILKDLDRLAESMRLAEEPEETHAEDPILGVSARAIS